MPEKTPGRPRKRAANVAPRRAPAPLGASGAMKQYIAGQLKAMYDEVAAQPIPDRLLRLLDRLDSDTEK
jgi:Anti-sigma factor NepR